MDEAPFRDWVDRYFAAWRSNDAEEVAALFAEDALYYVSPFRDPQRGRDQIVSAWVEGGVQRDLQVQYEPLAVSDRIGLAHWTVSFTDNGSGWERDGVLVIEFDDQDRCLVHREWFVTRQGTPPEEAR
jgi:ketosteroid isomerase-like protein